MTHSRQHQGPKSNPEHKFFDNSKGTYYTCLSIPLVCKDWHAVKPKVVDDTGGRNDCRGLPGFDIAPYGFLGPIQHEMGTGTSAGTL